MTIGSNYSSKKYPKIIFNQNDHKGIPHYIGISEFDDDDNELLYYAKSNIHFKFIEAKFLMRIEKFKRL